MRRPGGRPLSWLHFSCRKGLNGVPYDPFSISGADHWYTVGAQRVRALQNDLAEQTFRPGWLRSVSGGWTNWAVESFMDEAAHAAGVDPVKFRLQMLDGAGRNAGSAPNSVGGAHRQAAVLARVAEKAGWGKPTAERCGARHCDDVRPGTPDAHLDSLRRSRACRPHDRPRNGREADAGD